MKYIYKILAVTFLAGSFYACDNASTDFDNFDDVTRPGHIITKTLEMQDHLYEKLVSKLNKVDDKDAIAFLKTNKAFSDVAPAEKYGPFIIEDLYHSADAGSTVNLKYRFIANRGASVAPYTGESYTVSTENYKKVWNNGNLFTESFTPIKNPSKNIPNILKTAFPEAKNGDVKNVNYFYSKKEPVSITAVGKTFLSENFSSLEKDKPVVIAGWINKDLLGTYSWVGKYFANEDNYYAQASSFKSNGKNDNWLISKKIKLDNVANLYLSFDVNVGNYNGECLSVYVSSNFDGNENNINAATWTDVTTSFKFPKPATGYAGFASAGNHSLDLFKDKNVNFAFRYQGDATVGVAQLTTTYQIDNVTAYEGIPGIDVESKDLEYALYQFDGTVWKAFSNKQIILLQPADYTEMGHTNATMPADKAKEKLPVNLKAKYPYALEGDVYTVVYYTAKDKCYADEFTLKNGKWVANSFVEVREGQFIKTATAWVFDPTILVTILGNNPAYQTIVNYVASHQATINDKLVNSGKNAEFYYGFNAYYPNITYRDKDRALDPLFPGSGTASERTAFMDQRTIEGLIVFLTEAYPNSKAEISGIKLFAKLKSVKIYSDPSSNLPNALYTYDFQCIGDNDWIALRRTSDDDGKVTEYNAEVE